MTRIGQPIGNMQMELDLCNRLQTMTLDARWTNGIRGADNFTMPSIVLSDTIMSDDPSYQSDASNCSSSASTTAEPFGCAYLQAIQAQLECFPTTGGEYLESIFTHRAVFHACPPAHRSCARGFSDIAQMLERRPGRADRDSDAEAAAAFRHEALVIASSL